MEAAEEDAATPKALLDLSYDLLRCVIEQLERPPDICRFGHACKAAATIAHADELWALRLRRIFPEARPARLPSQMQCFASLAYGWKTAAPFGLGCLCTHSGCHDTLLLPSGERCACVAARAASLPLCLGSLSRTRCGSSALSCASVDLSSRIDQSSAFRL